ncbi:MAG: uridine kinase [Vampirovibrio sp.]|jgi:uridine kinase|nr:uridine kinase [Vampirovibrio sp.]
MEQRLQQAVSNKLKDIFQRDSQQEAPVVQSVSLFFWQNLIRWVHHIANVPAPFTIALSGPSGCGKSFIREKLVYELSKVSEVSAFTQDNYYRDFEADFPHLPLERFYDEIDFDDPAHIRFLYLGRDLERLRRQTLGHSIKIPRLRFGTPTRKPTILENDTELKVTPFVITEGIHAFYEASILPHYDFKIYVDVDEHTRRARWLERNRLENRGTTDNMWNTTVECLNNHLLPGRALADLVINNNVPREQVTQFLQDVVQALAAPLMAAQKEIA